MYSVALEDCNLGEFKGLGYADIIYDAEGKVKKLEKVKKVVQQCQLILFHRKIDSHWWDPNYGSDILVGVGRKSLPVMFLFPLQVSINDCLEYLKQLHKRGCYQWDERLGDFEVYTLIQDSGGRIVIEIKIKTESQVAHSIQI